MIFLHSIRPFMTLTIALAVIGCSSTAKLNYLNEPYAINEIRVPLSISGVDIIDSRNDTTSRAVDIPRHPKKGQADEINQALNDKHRKLITEEMTVYLETSDKEARVEVEVLEGVKKFEGATFGRTEYVKVKLGVTLYDDVHSPFYLKSSGEAMYEIQSLKASNEFIEKLYQKALKASLYKCFEGIRNSMENLK